MTDTEGQHRAAPQSLLQRINLSEPVRLRVYAVAVAVAALLVGYGVLGADDAGRWLALAAAALSGGGALAESVRAAVVSPVTARRAAVDAADAAASDYATHPMTAAQRAMDWNGIPT